MLSQIVNVLRQARKTFASNPELMYQNIELLKAILDRTTSEDVNLNPQFATEDLWKRPGKAPVTYIDIFENHHFTVGVFVLKPGMKLPLHDHPEMHGLIKVISGKIKVRSYSVVQNESTSQSNLFAIRNLKASRFAQLRSNILLVEKNDDVVLDAQSETCILEPEKRNLHEIESVDGPAAFIDILAPPYESIIPNVGERKCNYYCILSQDSPNVFKLQKVGCPSWYWTDSYQYSGPEIPQELAN
ncbi:2-aminoethanethiol dioxygenase [Aethina tumida]|uniref:2-aminoethanethiol dioxygenase n=1 Tax=Aethina tumida TaxID=116153 RepID=UPI00096B00F2|nr:2-aminoethanethiol dioxygenase [Aethina tumida]